jgi:hypothetical protein
MLVNLLQCNVCEQLCCEHTCLVKVLDTCCLYMSSSYMTQGVMGRSVPPRPASLDDNLPLRLSQNACMHEIMHARPFFLHDTSPIGPDE